MYDREFRRAEAALAQKLEAASLIARNPDREAQARAVEERLSNALATTLFADALLAAGRLEEGIEEYREADTPLSPDVLTRFGNRFLAEGDFDQASAYYRAAHSEIAREQFLPFWPAFLARTDSVEAVLLYCQNLGLPIPIAKLNALGDRVLAGAATIDRIQLGYAFRAFAATGNTEKLVRLGDCCRASGAMDRELTEFVVSIYEAAHASDRILDVARSLGPWADLSCFQSVCEKANHSADSADFVEFGTKKEREGQFREAIAAYGTAGATAKLEELARRVIDEEKWAVGRTKLSGESKAIAMEAFAAIARTKHRLAA